MLGVITGVLNVVPYLGAIIGGALAAMVALSDSASLAILDFLGLLLSIPTAAALMALMLRYVFNETAEGIEPDTGPTVDGENAKRAAAQRRVCSVIAFR